MSNTLGPMSSSPHRPGPLGSETDKELIEKVQRRAVKMISGLTGSTYEEKCKELGLDTLEERRRQQDLMQTYKIFGGKDRVR